MNYILILKWRRNGQNFILLGPYIQPQNLEDQENRNLLIPSPLEDESTIHSLGVPAYIF
jgi:hypothetical protein